jgi:NhaP-type Na+/H+ or K+/H+ antiporter
MLATWCLIVGLLLVFMGLAGSVLRRFAFSTAMIYLAVGYALGPAGAGLISLDPFRNTAVLQAVSEVALLISLFVVGLKLRAPLLLPIWKWPLRLGSIAMLATIGLVAGIGYLMFDLPLGAAVLLGAILAPTDPVLASDVQMRSAEDRDRLRFALSGEGGLNDGVAFPFVMLGLGMLSLHDLGPSWGRWLAIDLVWGLAAGLISGWLLGRAVSALVIHVRGHYQEALGYEEFFTLGLIGLSYGVAHVIAGYGFLAVFAAGIAMRKTEHLASGARAPSSVIGSLPAGREEEVAVDPGKAPAYMAETLLDFGEQLERIAEVVVVLLLGSLLSATVFNASGLLLAALLFFLIRPLSVMLALPGAGVPVIQHRLMAWFGIRGIGSFYYLMFAIDHHLESGLAQRFVQWVLCVVALSIVLHGVSAAPLMEGYYKRFRSGQTKKV